MALSESGMHSFPLFSTPAIKISQIDQAKFKENLPFLSSASDAQEADLKNQVNVVTFDTFPAVDWELPPPRQRQLQLMLLKSLRGSKKKKRGSAKGGQVPIFFAKVKWRIMRKPDDELKSIDVVNAVAIAPAALRKLIAAIKSSYSSHSGGYFVYNKHLLSRMNVIIIHLVKCE